MTSSFRIRALCVTLLCAMLGSLSRARATQGDASRGTEPAASARSAVLDRDPRLLARAADGQWKDFGNAPLRPEDVPEGMRASRAALLQHDLPRALEALYAVLDAQHEYPPALHQMGILYFRLQRYSDAIEVFERFLRQVPAKVGETRTLGHCYYSLGDYPKARTHYERVLATAPDEVEALRGLALTHMRLGDGAKALELLGLVLESDPAHVDAWTWKAQILFDSGKASEALEAATKARDLDRYQPRPWFLSGQILMELGRDEDAVAAQSRYDELQTVTQELRSIESRLEYAPHQLPLLVRRVELHRKVGDVARTRQALAEVLAQRPDDVSVRIFALDVLVDMGDDEGAVVAARSLESAGADSAEAWKRLELYYARLKDFANQLRAGERHRRLRAK